MPQVRSPKPGRRRSRPRHRLRRRRRLRPRRHGRRGHPDQARTVRRRVAREGGDRRVRRRPAPHLGPASDEPVRPQRLGRRPPPAPGPLEDRRWRPATARSAPAGPAATAGSPPSTARSVPTRSVTSCSTRPTGRSTSRTSRAGSTRPWGTATSGSRTSAATVAFPPSAARTVRSWAPAGGEVDVATSGPLLIGRALGDVNARSAHGAIRVAESDRRIRPPREQLRGGRGRRTRTAWPHGSTPRRPTASSATNGPPTLPPPASTGRSSCACAPTTATSSSAARPAHPEKGSIAMTSAIVATGLCKSYGKQTVLDGIDLDIAAGTVFARSDRTGPARPRPCTSSPPSSRQTPGRSRSRGTTWPATPTASAPRSA